MCIRDRLSTDWSSNSPKCQHQQKYVVLAKCVEDVVRRKEHSFGNWGTQSWLNRTNYLRNSTEVENKNGEDCEPGSLRVMIATFDRHLKDKQYPLLIVKHREFHSSKQVLEGKAKLLRQAGRGSIKARNLTKEEEELLFAFIAQQPSWIDVIYF